MSQRISLTVSDPFPDSKYVSNDFNYVLIAIQLFWHRFILLLSVVITVGLLMVLGLTY